MDMQQLRTQLLPLLEAGNLHTLAHLARECGASELDVARALPENMCRMASATVFDAVWQELHQWENATFIMQHCGSVVEIKGKVPLGKHGGGYFNLDHGQPLGGHIHSESIAHLAFVSLPFMGLESHSIQCFNTRGEGLFAVYAGREKRQLIPSVRASFFDMRTRYSLGA